MHRVTLFLSSHGRRLRQYSGLLDEGARYVMDLAYFAVPGETLRHCIAQNAPTY